MITLIYSEVVNNEIERKSEIFAFSFPEYSRRIPLFFKIRQKIKQKKIYRFCNESVSDFFVV